MTGGREHDDEMASRRFEGPPSETEGVSLEVFEFPVEGNQPYTLRQKQWPAIS
jgi:hypothetical protein